MTYLDLSVLENVAKVLCDAVLRAQVLLCKVDGFLVGKDGRWVGAKELLLHAHVMIGDGEDGRAILGCLGWKVLFILLKGGRVESFRQHHLL